MKRIFVLLSSAVLAASARADFDVYFLRHGETSWNRAKILQGSTSYTDLTPRGVRMAERTAAGLKDAGVSFDRVYTSPYLRARRTAEIVVGKSGVRPVVDARLREMCFGRYEGVRSAKGRYPDDNLRCFFEDPERYVPQGAGAESFADVGRRLREFLERELAPLDGQVDRVLCVAHSLVLKSLLRELFGDDVPAAAKVPIQRNCCVHVLRYAKGAFTLKEAGRVFYEPREFDALVRTRTVAHRGAGDLVMPEASRAAYSNAVATVSDIVKLDLQETKDGVIVMGHDVSLKRNMGWDAKIADLIYGEILEKGRFKPVGGFADERIVRLDEAIEIVRPVPEFWIDFKFFSPEFAEKVLAEFRRAKIDVSRLMVATFSKPALKYFRDNHPEIRRVGHLSGEWTREQILDYRDQYGLFGVNLPVLKRETSPEDVAFLRQRGLWTSLWFVQDAACAEAYRAAGADAFVTDEVTAVREVLEDRCPWVTREERELVRPRCRGVEFQPGTPETDATRFYANAEKTKWIDINYDEAKTGEGAYELEDPLTFADGRKVATKADWAARRKEILALFEREVYGRLPPKPAEMTFEVTKEEMSADRFATTRVYRQYFRADKTGPAIDWFVVVPRHAKGKAPVFLHLNYGGLASVAAMRTNHYPLPWDQLVAHGYAFMSAKYTQITSDLKTGVGDVFNGVCELWGPRDPKATDNPGALMVWAWGLMRGLDLAERIPEIDAAKNVVIGSSRLGKAALLAAAYDERFAVCIPNQTGAVGVQLMKRTYGETLKAQHLTLPHWYCQAAWKYEDDPKAQPFDQHLLLACVAPRNLLLECYHKKWFDPKGEFLAAKAASPAWEFLTGKGLGLADMPPPYDDSSVRPPFGYVRRTECHGLSPYDWKWAIDFANRALR